VRPKQFVSLSYVWRKPCTFLALTLTPSLNVPNEIPHEPRHLGVPSGVSKTIAKPMVCLAQTVHQSCVKISTISNTDQNKLPHENRHLGEPSSAYKMISTFGANRAPILH
jgi:hypothetical protein